MRKAIMNLFRRILPAREAPKPIPSGVYPYQSPEGQPKPYRLHLRVEPDGTALLIVNATTVLHLNETAAAHAHRLVLGDSEDEAASSIAARYRVSRSRALKDHRFLREQIETMAVAPDIEPETYFGISRTEPHDASLSAPLRLDLALTYATNPRGEQDPLAAKRVDRELSTQEWSSILQRAWDAGIPHVTFTGGEPTRREDLADLIAFAQATGQVTGLLTDGRRLADAAYLNRLANAGLDHILVTWQPDDADSRAGLQAALASDVFTAAHLTLTPENLLRAPALLADMQALGVPALSLSAASGVSPEALAAVRDRAADMAFSLVWDLPVPYSANHPLAAEVDVPPRGAGRAWLYVEPDGDVLPAQGVSGVLGNMLRDPWEAIWARARQAHPG
jgi:hypothetical protein